MTGDDDLTTADRPRRRRSDAQRNLGALLEAAKAVFAASGVNAPAKDITDLAGVGVGTLYRHFPQRADLVKAVLEREIDACADAGPGLLATHPPRAALVAWLHRYTDLLATKDGLAAALHKGEPAFDALAAYFMQHLGPVLSSLLGAAREGDDVRGDVSATDVLYAVGLLCIPAPGEANEFNLRMVGVFVDGLLAGPQSTDGGSGS